MGVLKTFWRWWYPPKPIKYSVVYMATNSEGLTCTGDMELALQNPITGKADIEHIKIHIMKGGSYIREGLIILNWQRFEDEN